MDGKLFLEEFNDIFLNEIIELPLIRKIDHAIDLVTNSVPVSRAPYAFLAQNESLENQLLDLLNKNYL